MTQGLILAFIALVGLWLLVRMCVFFADRMDSVTLPPDIYLITAWMLRLILIVIAAGVMILAIPGALFAIGMGDAFSGRTSHIAYIVLFSIWIYALAAVVMNFPFFPLEWNMKGYLPAHLVFLPCLAVLSQPQAFLVLILMLGAFSLLWRLCLIDRTKIC
jgi:hypothetical protein